MRRVAITGVGLVTPAGLGRESTWKRVLSGKSTATRISYFDPEPYRTHIACEVRGFDGERYFAKRDLKHTDKFVQYAVASTVEALADAGFEDGKIPPATAEMWAVYFGSGMGGLKRIEDTHRTLLEKGPRRISPYFVPDSIINMAAGIISMRFGLKGPSLSHVSACATGAHSIGEAVRLIERGDADAAIAGGTDADITPIGIGGFAAMRAMSMRNEEPERASRPFDKERDGFVMGEGAGALVLEELEAAKARGATIYAEVAGYAATSDAHHITTPSPDGDGAIRCMTKALKDAGVSASELSYVNAHGTSTMANDKTESIAIRKALGSFADSVPVSSTKAVTGHMLGAAGAVEIALCALAIRDQVVPPTGNHESPGEGCDLDYIPKEARQMKVVSTMSNSFGFGGTNATVVLRNL